MLGEVEGDFNLSLVAETQIGIGKVAAREKGLRQCFGSTFHFHFQQVRNHLFVYTSHPLCSILKGKSPETPKVLRNRTLSYPMTH